MNEWDGKPGLCDEMEILERLFQQEREYLVAKCCWGVWSNEDRHISLEFGNMEILNDLDESSYKAAQARLDLEEVWIGDELVTAFRDLIMQWNREMEI